MQIKVCGMRDKTNIQEILVHKPNYLGFIFYKKSPRFVGEDFDATILKNIPKTIQKVGVFVDEKQEIIEEKIRHYTLDILQFHGNESPEFCKKFQSIVPIIRAFSIHENFDFQILNDFNSCTDYFLFDGHKGGSGIPFNWSLLQKYSLKKPYFLAGGIDSDSLNTIKKLNEEQLFCLDINSKFENHFAIKDSLKVGKFINSVRIEYE